MRVRENGGDQHFLKLTLSLPTSAHCSLPTTSAHFILAKLSKLPPRIGNEKPSLGIIVDIFFLFDQNAQSGESQVSISGLP